MENLAHSASFHSNEKSAPSKPGTKQVEHLLRVNVRNEPLGTAFRAGTTFLLCCWDWMHKRFEDGLVFHKHLGQLGCGLLAQACRPTSAYRADPRSHKHLCGPAIEKAASRGGPSHGRK